MGYQQEIVGGYIFIGAPCIDVCDKLSVVTLTQISASTGTYNLLDRLIEFNHPVIVLLCAFVLRNELVKWSAQD